MATRDRQQTPIGNEPLFSQAAWFLRFMGVAVAKPGHLRKQRFLFDRKDRLMTKQIELTQGKVALVSDEDYEWLILWKWHYSAGMAVHNGPKARGRQPKCLMHRLIMDAPAGMVIDHINHDTLDNRRCNLRICTHAENIRNGLRPKNNTSGFKGVFWERCANRWRARATLDGQSYHLGLFRDPADAARAYDAFVREHFKEFALCNF